MSLEQITVIDEQLVRDFGDRKTEGRLDLVCDVDSRSFYAVPRNMEHKDFMPQLQGAPSSLIPVQLHLERRGRGYAVKGLLVGVSSYEAERGVRHSPRHLKEAYELSILFLASQAGVEIDPQRFKILFDYATVE